jgi:hypothetical protein
MDVSGFNFVLVRKVHLNGFSRDRVLYTFTALADQIIQ